jgi:CSLREA domain-containing protein
MVIRLAAILCILSVVSLGLALVPPAQPAHAATFTVDSTGDDHDADAGDGVCAAASGSCTLRAAIQEANALGGAHTIALPAGTFVAEDLQILADVTFVGEGEDSTVSISSEGGESRTHVSVSSVSVGSGSTSEVRTEVSINSGSDNSDDNDNDDAAIRSDNVTVRDGTVRAGNVTVKPGVVKAGNVTVRDGKVTIRRGGD